MPFASGNSSRLTRMASQWNTWPTFKSTFGCCRRGVASRGEKRSHECERCTHECARHSGFERTRATLRAMRPFILFALFAAVAMAQTPGHKKRTVSDEEVMRVHRSTILIDTHNDVTSFTVNGMDIGKPSPNRM